MFPTNSLTLVFVSLGIFLFVPIEYAFILLATLLLYWNYQTKKSFLNWFYIFYFILAFSLPALLRILGQYGAEYTIYGELSFETGLYIFLYIFLLVFTKKVIESSLPENMGERLNYFFIIFNTNELRGNPSVSILIAYLFYFLVIFYLDSVGWYRSGDFALEREASTKPPQQISVLVEFGPVLLILSSIMWRQTKKSINLLIYAIGFLTLFYLALISGSRWLVISTAIVLFYNHEFFRKHTLLIFVLGVPFIGVLFPTLLIYRSAGDLSLYDSFSEVLGNDFEVVGAILEVISGRINMLSTTNLIVSNFGALGGGGNYLGNLTGLIPRLLWPDKPSQFNSNDLGAELGIIGEGDTLTSISLSIIGESFYELAFFGLIVACLQGVIFALVDSMDKNNRVANLLYFLFTIKLVTLGTFYIFLPEIINFFIVGWIVLTGIALMLYKSNNNERSTSSY